MRFRPPAELRALALLAMLLAAGTWLGGALPQGPWFHAGGLVAKAAAWDAPIYEQIATRGYRGPGGGPDVAIAFFPGWPVLLAPIYAVTNPPETARLIATFLAGALGVASLFAFGRLARATLPAGPAERAIFLYAVYPGAHFLFQPYPTAAMQLATMLTLHTLVAGRGWRAAGIAGLATAFGPLMVFTSAAIALTAAWRGARLTLPLVALAAVSGLLAFIAWQCVAFGDPFAFVAAGRVVEAPLTFAAHVGRAALLLIAVPELVRAVDWLHRAASLAGAGEWSPAQIAFEDAADLTVLSVMIVGAVAALRLREKSLALAALLTIAGFVWFAGAPQGGQAAIRLVYPAIGAFLGLAAIGHARPALGWIIALVFGSLLVLDQAFLVAGYWVV